MDSGTWEHIKDLLQAALELVPERRLAFLAKACGDDESLRSQVESLLEHHERAGSFLANPLGELLPASKRSAVTSSTFAADEIVAGRFRIVCFIGAGGMGEVYEANDLELGARVALKTIRPEIASQPHSLSRFKREIQLARRVTHPNVCRMFDLGQHRPAAEVGRSDGVVIFLTMELLEGETLAARLRRAGRMSASDALPLVRQMAAALAAAHDVGVIHRDFKPGNVMLAPAKSGGKDVRAVVTDFGLARAAADQTAAENLQSSVTAGEHILGTLAYMAPEQLEARELTPATDVYALGLVAYEMLTGHRPFPGNPYDRLRKTAPSPRVHAPDLDPSWESLISRCLEPEPSARFATADESAQALARLTSGAPAKNDQAPNTSAAQVMAETPALHGDGTRLPERRHRSAVQRRLALVAALVAVAAVGTYIDLHRAQSLRLTDKDTVLLADFTNRTGDPVFDDTLKQGLAVALRQSPFLSVLSDGQVASTLGLMERSPGTAVTGEVAREVCQRTGSRVYIAGSVASLGSQYVLGLKAVGCAGGETLAEEQATAQGKENVLNTMGQEAVKLRGELGESLASVQKFDTPMEQATTSSLEALKACSLGVKARNEQGPSASLPFFQRATELDPNFAFAYVALGVQSANVGQTARARECLSKAFALRERTSEWEKFDIAAQYYTLATGELAKADQTWQEWIENYPRDDLPFNNLGSDREIEGDYAAAVELIRQSLRLAPNSVEDYENLGASLMALGRFDEARTTFEQALSRKLDDDNLHMGLYGLAFLSGDAQAMARQVTWLEGKPGAHEMISAEADTEAYGGNLARARELTRRAVEEAVRTGNPEAAALWRVDGALREATFGNFGEAHQESEAALKLAPENRDIEVQAALVEAWSGDQVRVQRLESDLKKNYPLGTLVNSYWLPAVDARMELGKGNPPDAVRQLQAVSHPLELGIPIEAVNIACLYPVYTRGEAYLAAGQGSSAAAEFQKILDHSGIVQNCVTGALARVGLARAYALEAGFPGSAGVPPANRKEQKAGKMPALPGKAPVPPADALAKARAAYQDFFALWKDADPDIPILRQAQAEYAKLNAPHPP